MKVIICGGGNIAHALVAAVTRWQDVTVLTRNPEKWSERINGMSFLVHATADGAAVSDSNVILVALPRFAIRGILSKIDPYLHKGQILCFTPGNDQIPNYVTWYEKRGIAVACIQRVPYIARIQEYGRSVRMSEPRQLHRVFVSMCSAISPIQELCRNAFEADVAFLHSPFTFVFNNSNPLLHPSRIAVLFKGWRGKMFLENPAFYAEWTDESSELYLTSDREMKAVIQCIGDGGECLADYESVPNHYGISTAHELTEKLRSISGFKGILSPMVQVGEFWHPDFNSRYFTEDVPYGTVPIQMYARQFGVPTPTIDYLIEEVFRIQE